MNTEKDSDRALWDALESLDELGQTGQPEGALDREAREYVELLGLLPYALEEAPVRSSLKNEILQAIAAEPSATTEDASIPILGAVTNFPEPHMVPSQSRANPWSWALAAMLGLCVVGLAFLAGHMQAQRATIDQLLAHGTANPSGRAIGPMHDRFEVIRTIAPQVYPLQPSVDQPSPVNARGMIYVCPKHQRWYLSLKGLPSPPEGQEYRFWFMTATGAVRGGLLKVGSDSSVVLEATSMPTGTVGFSVTLERNGSPLSMSEERIVLRADEAISL